MGRKVKFLVVQAAERSGFRVVCIYFFFISVIFSVAEPEWLHVLTARAATLGLEIAWSRRN